jgi:hypothetical protein
MSMFNNVALDVFIGLVFVFLLYSLLATIVQEMIATRLGFRARVLEKAILRMLEDGKTTSDYRSIDRLNGFLHLLGLKNILKNKLVALWFYAHPLIKYLAEDNYYSKPAYLDPSNFSKVMIDLLKGFTRPESQVIQTIHNSITAGTIYKLPLSISSAQHDISNPAYRGLLNQNMLHDDPLLTASQTVPINENTALFLRSLWLEAGADINVFRSKLEEWFNDTMDRATGWYKRYTRIILFILGLVIAVAFNVDTIAIHRILSSNKPARDQLVQMAISNKDNLDPNKLLSHGQSDSLLNVTYQMVANDAKAANDVLGLGRPWSDSCKMCRDAFDDKTKTCILQPAIKALQNKIGIVESSFASIDSCNRQLTIKDSIMSTKLSGTDKSILEKDTSVLIGIKGLARANLKTNHGESLNDFKDSLQKMSTLCDRCPLIRQSKIFQYSPNQRGGVETILGWLITALAVTLGAPFWFDLLSKLVSIRGANKKLPTNDDAGKTQTAGSQSNPVIVNVNPGSSGEAVG